MHPHQIAAARAPGPPAPAPRRATAVLVWLAIYPTITALSWLLHGPGRILERNVALAVRQKLSTDLMERLFSAPLVWHEAQHGVETGHRVQQGTRALYDFAQSQFIYLQSATSLIGPVIALWVISENVTRRVFDFGTLAASATCHAMASPSRSRSVAR